MNLLDGLAMAALVSAAVPAGMFAGNVWPFRRPKRAEGQCPAVSVLIPARNEELSIEAAVQSALAAEGVALEVVVLDDGSTDRTAELVLALAAGDERARLEAAPKLPAGWNGKQHACWVLASRAKYDLLCFLDADVRLGPQALLRMASELSWQYSRDRTMGLVSGFPRQETGTVLEWLLLPLIHFVLLGFLPMAGERWSRKAGFAAGCGQFMIVRRDAYFAAGGHGAIRTTMHDGLLLPQLFRRMGFKTRVYDLSRDAVCRMYRSAGEVWRGLGKNATEGMAAPGRIGVFTVLLLAGQVLPLPLLVWAWVAGDGVALERAGIALALGLGMRVVSAWRYGQSWGGVVAHPVGVLVTLVLQWWSLGRKLAGRQATWKQREYPVG